MYSYGTALARGCGFRSSISPPKSSRPNLGQSLSLSPIPPRLGCFVPGNSILLLNRIFPGISPAARIGSGVRHGRRVRGLRAPVLRDLRLPRPQVHRCLRSPRREAEAEGVGDQVWHRWGRGTGEGKLSALLFAICK
jgi:hypothetical protein